MAKGLNDKNLQTAIGEIKSKGFTAKFWQDYRGMVAQGCGVAKCMNTLKALGVSPSGELKNVDVDDLEAVVKAFGDLDTAMAKAESRAKKGGVLTKHTYEFCKAFGKVINDRHVNAQQLLKTALKQREAMLQKNRDDTEKELSKFKKEQEKHQGAVIGEMADLDKRARNIAKACDAMIADIQLAAKDISKLHEGLKSQSGPDGKVAGEIADRFEKALTALQKKYKLPMHGDNLNKALPKLFKEVTGLFPQYAKLDYVKKERMSLGGSIKEAQIALKKAGDAFKVYADLHRAFAGDLKRG